MSSTHDIEANQEPLPRVGEFKLYEGAEDKDIQASETPAPPGLASDVNSSTIVPQQAEPRENDDFDDRAAEFWAVYVREARSHDEASIGTWKDDMEGVIIFVRTPPSTHACKPISHALSPSGWFILGRLDRLHRRE
jgi:hypothetical protein